MTETGHPIDPIRLSAYYDGVLAPNEREAVEEHLAECQACRARLAECAWFGNAVRSEPVVPVSAALDRRVAALLQPQPPTISRHTALLFLLAPRVRPVLMAAALIVLLVGFLLFGSPFAREAGGPGVVAAYPCDEPADCAIALQFRGPVDHARVERSLQLDPPTPMRLDWRGDTLFVSPTAPLQPAGNYTLSLQPIGPAATPVVVRFVAAGAGTPVAVVTPRAASPEATVAQSQPAAAQPTVSSVALPSATPTVTTTAMPTATGPCAVQPVRGFGTLYRDRPTVAAQLGCARGPERGLELVIQPFQYGRLFWRGDRKEILALLDDGRWSAYPDSFAGAETATPAAGEPVRGFGKLWRERPDLRARLGTPTEPEGPTGAEVEEFDRGVLIWTADRTIVVLYADGRWERYPDTFVDPPTVTPTAALVPTNAPSPAPTATASAPPPVSSAAPGPSIAADCQIQPVRTSALVYRQNPDIAARLGCARDGEIGPQLARQTFDGGLMLWRNDTREVLVLIRESPVLRRARTWAGYADTWNEGERLTDAGTPPAERFVPARGFGKLWREKPDVRVALGWATAPEQGLAGSVQEFAGGRILWSTDRQIYVLFAGGDWQSFADQ